jgi:hypothetical protein
MSKQDPKVNRTPDVNRTEKQPQAPGQGGRMTEASPNPHSEQNVAEMPVRTDQRDSTASRNVATNPSTREGRIHPSVGESVGGGVADTDSMFNNADPQSAEIGPSGSRTQARNHGEERHPRKKKTA